MICIDKQRWCTKTLWKIFFLLRSLGHSYVFWHGDHITSQKRWRSNGRGSKLINEINKPSKGSGISSNSSKFGYVSQMWLVYECIHRHTGQQQFAMCYVETCLIWLISLTKNFHFFLSWKYWRNQSDSSICATVWCLQYINPTWAMFGICSCSN